MQDLAKNVNLWKKITREIQAKDNRLKKIKTK